MSSPDQKMDKIISLAKRRGFIFPTAEKYGGLAGFWDWGPLGVELKNNIKKAWWRSFVQMRNDVVGLDSAIITNPSVWEKSGHLKGFSDKLAECKKCHHRFKADEIDIEKSCPDCGQNDFQPAREFNLMLKTHVGPADDTASIAYLRPETAQNIFVNFENVVQSSRLKIPFGIAQIGKAFRNEITPGNFIYRSREFEQMEIEFFVTPNEDKKWFDYWTDMSLRWFLDLGINEKNIRKHPQKKDELAHYAKETVDIEYKWPFDKGWAELVGVANRTDYDLKAHGLDYKGEAGSFVPYVIEPSFGVERPALAFLLDAYEEISGGRTTTTKSNKEQEIVLRLHKSLSPVKVAILPLSKKDNLKKVAVGVYDTLKYKYACVYDEVGSIGRRYRRQDEIGTPYCVTVDFESLDDKKVTVRDRDTMEQARIKIEELMDYLNNKFDVI